MKIPRIIKQRNTYVDRIRPFMRKTLVKVMVGHRRVGKSFILYQLMELIRKEESDANIIYINKEDVNFIDIKTYKELNDYILSKSVDDRMNYILKYRKYKISGWLSVRWHWMIIMIYM